MALCPTCRTVIPCHCHVTPAVPIRPGVYTGRPDTRSSTVTDLHLIISQPTPGDWHGRLDVAEALEAAGWTGNDDGQLLRKNGAAWAVTNDCDDSSLTCPNGATFDLPSDTPTVVVVAACLAAAATPTPSEETTR